MVSQGQAFQCIGQASTVSFGHFRPGAPTVLFECVHVCFCAYMCVFSALIYQHDNESYDTSTDDILPKENSA